MSKKHLKIFGTYMFVIILLMIFLIGCDTEKCYACEKTINNGEFGFTFLTDNACGEDERNAKINNDWNCDSEPYNSPAVGNITGPGDGSMFEATISVFKDTTDCPCGESEKE